MIFENLILIYAWDSCFIYVEKFKWKNYTELVRICRQVQLKAHLVRGCNDMPTWFIFILLSSNSFCLKHINFSSNIEHEITVLLCHLFLIYHIFNKLFLCNARLRKTIVIFLDNLNKLNESRVYTNYLTLG